MMIKSHFRFIAHCKRFLFGAIVLGFFTTASAVTPWTILINTNFVVNITNYNANVTNADNAAAISNAIVAAAAGGTTNGLSGGVVRIPAGTFLSGPFPLKSAVNLQLDSGAILRMLQFTNYPKTFFTNITTTFVTNLSIITTNHSTNITWTAGDFITASSLHDVEISGQGMIDGQGLPWWPYANTNGDTRPVMIRISSCNRTLIQDVILSNSPMFHIAVGGGNNAKNTTVQRVIIRAPSSGANPPSHNTDACDVSGSNILVQSNNISVGDDNFTCGGGTSEMLIMNNTYGDGHGLSIGSFTSPSVSNMLAINCTFNQSDCGVRIKSDRDRGGFVHNINYFNLSMTNVRNAILIYTEYTNQVSKYRSLDSISPAVAASYGSAPYVAGKTPTYRDITISNVTATAQANRAAGLIWGLPESCISNVNLINVHLTGSRTFGIYYARNVKIIDCSHTVPNGVSQFSFYNTDVTFSNSAPSSTVVTLDGVTSNGVANSFSFYNSLPTLKNTNAIALNSSVTLGSSTFTISNNLTLFPGNTLNFVLGTNAATIVVKGNLSLGGTNNIFAGGGFTNGVYTLITYTGNLSGNLPTLGVAPAGYAYTFNTNIAGQVKLIVSGSIPPPPAPTNLIATASNTAVTLTWSPVAAATDYNIKRSLVSGGSYTVIGNTATTNFTDASVLGGVKYFYVVSARNAGGEGDDSAEVNVTISVTELFNDVFSASSLNSVTPSSPLSNSTSYQIVSSKGWNPVPSISLGHLQFGIAGTTSGSIEMQALFTTNAVTLANTNDSISLVVTFTDAGILTQTNVVGFGLYRAGTNNPVPGGLNGTATTSSSTATDGYAQKWIGYFGQLSFTNASSQIVMRPAQTVGTLANNCQDVLTTGSGSSSFNNPAGTIVGATSTSASVVLGNGNVYTDVLTITLIGSNTLGITNSLYNGADTTAPLLSQFGSIASGSTYLTNAFDALAIGWRSINSSATATAIDINKISIVANTVTVETNPLSQIPANIVSQMVGNQLQLSWPSDHIGWILQIQTNDLSRGLGTNWVNVPDSTATNQISIPVTMTNGSVFLRMVLP